MASSPMQGFTKAIEERAEAPVIAFYLKTTEGTDENGEEIIYRYDEFHASKPLDDKLVLLLANAARRDATLADEAAAIFDLFKSVLPANEYRILQRRFEDDRDMGVDYDMLGQVVEWLMEQWQDFPTQQPAASSSSRGSSGTKSTGRARGKGSIPSTSR